MTAVGRAPVVIAIVSLVLAIVASPRATFARTPAPVAGRSMLTTLPAAVVDTPPPGVITPHYGTGVFWAEPLPATPREIASKLSGMTQAQLTDSMITAEVQTYLDAMVKERSGGYSQMPSWTTTIAGKKVGIDQRWIYLGGLKIPTALLAFLPIKVQANPTQAELGAKLKVMTDDLMEAARRSQTLEEFKDAVKDLHQQTERGREFERNQRIPPDTSVHG